MEEAETVRTRSTAEKYCPASMSTEVGSRKPPRPSPAEKLTRTQPARKRKLENERTLHEAWNTGITESQTLPFSLVLPF